MAKTMNHQLTSQEAQVLSEAVLTVQSDLNLLDNELATILGISTFQFMKRKQSDFLIMHRNENAFTQGVLFVSFYQGLRNMLGDDINTLRYWLNTNNTCLGDKPTLLIQKKNGLSEVAIYIESFRR